MLWLLSPEEKNEGFKNPGATRSRSVSEPFSARIARGVSCVREDVRKKKKTLSVQASTEDLSKDAG